MIYQRRGKIGKSWKGKLPNQIDWKEQEEGGRRRKNHMVVGEKGNNKEDHLEDNTFILTQQPTNQLFLQERMNYWSLSKPNKQEKILKNNQTKQTKSLFLLLLCLLFLFLSIISCLLLSYSSLPFLYLLKNLSLMFSHIF